MCFTTELKLWSPPGPADAPTGTAEINAVTITSRVRNRFEDVIACYSVGGLRGYASWFVRCAGPLAALRLILRVGLLVFVLWLLSHSDTRNLVQAKLGDAKLALDVAKLCEIDRSDHVHNGERLWFGGKHREALYHTTFAHEDHVEAAFALAGDPGDSLPAGRIELCTNRV